MLSKSISQFKPLFLSSIRSFTSTTEQTHKKVYSKGLWDSKFYVNDFDSTNVQEVEYIRSPFYDIAKSEEVSGEKAVEFIENLHTKLSTLKVVEGVFDEPPPTKESVAYTRYADRVKDESLKHLFQFPRGQPYRQINAAELYKVQKPDNHREILIRQKSFLAEEFFGPFDLKESNLKDLFSRKDIYQDQSSQEYADWKEKLMNVIPNLNHDVIVQLSLYLAFDAKLNDKQVFSLIEEECIKNLHLMNITQISQLYSSTNELKPKHTSPRFNNLLLNKALEHINKASLTELMHIQQGFRRKQSKDLYLKVRQTMIDKKNKLFPMPKDHNDKDALRQRAENIANFFITFASNKPTKFGVYQHYYKEGINELLALYEEDLKEVPRHLDGDHLTRLSQALYILKSDEYENIWWRVEARANELKDQLDIYQATNILRSFSRSQENKQCAKDKTFYNFEPVILKNLDKVDDRDFTHLLYAYGIRSAGNPELYKAFDQKLNQIAERLDYPSLFNAIYYMLFRENTDRNTWEKLVSATLKQNDVLPIIYYRPFKASKFFLKGNFPDFDLTDYTDKFWHAERYFNALSQEQYIYADVKYMNFKAFLNTKCLVYPIPFITKHNLLLLHYAFNDQKIAINYHLNRFLTPESSKPTEMQKLASKLLKYEGWEILDLSEREFENWTYYERIDNIKGWLKEAKQRQVKKGIMEEQPKKYA